MPLLLKFLLTPSFIAVVIDDTVKYVKRKLGHVEYR